MSQRHDLSLLTGAAGPLIVRGGISILQFSALLYLAKFIAPAIFAEAAFMPIAGRLGALLALRGGAAIVLAAASVQPVRATSVVGRELAKAWRPALLIGLGIGVVFSITFAKSIEGSLLALFWWPAVVLATAYWLMAAEYLKGSLRATAGVLLEFAPLTVTFGVLALAARQGMALGVGSVEVAFVASQLVALTAAVLLVRGPKFAVTDEGLGFVDLESSRGSLTFSTVLTLGMPLVVISLVSLLGSPGEAGRLAAVIRLLSPTTIVVSAAAASFVPRILIDQGRNRTGSPIQGSAVRWSVVVVALLTVPYSAVLLAQPQILDLLLGDQYAGLHGALQVVAVGQIFRGLAGVAVELGQVTGHAAADTKAFAVGALVAAIAWPVLSSSRSVTVAGAFLFASLVATRSVRMFVVAYLRPPKVVPVAA